MTLDITGGTLAAGGANAIATVSAVSTIAAQVDTDYAVFVGGDGAGGTAYVGGNKITLTDGTIINVDSVDANDDVLTFTVDSGSTAPGILSENATLAQLSTDGTGTGFTLTLADVNQEVFAVTVGVPGNYLTQPDNPNTPTGGTGAGVTLTGTYGVNYSPVSATASLQDRAELTDSQNQTNYIGAGNGTFAGGTDYLFDEVLTLSENSIVTVDAIAATNYVTIAGQDETLYDGITMNQGGFSGGDGVGGTAYVGGNTITLTDGTVVLVDLVDGNGDVTEFTVTTSSTIVSTITVATHTQQSTSGTGTGFSLTTGSLNELRTGPVTAFTVASTGVDPFFLGQILGVTLADADGVGTLPVNQQTVSNGFTLTPTTNNAVTLSHVGATAIVTPIITNGIVSSVAVNNVGSSYLVGQPVLISHPGPTTLATASVASINGTGGITAIVVTNGGTGYETRNALVSVTHPNGQDFVGTVQVNQSGSVTGISVQNGGVLYNDVFPYTTISDATGSGANVNITGVTAGAISSIQLTDGGGGYSATPTILIFNSDVSPNNSATILLTVEANTYGTDPQEYYAVLSGQATDVVIADQIQYVLDYFVALGYNIRAQVNPSTGNTMQWQLIW